MSAAAPDQGPRYGVVAIGRNEGDRLRDCLLSLDRRQAPLIYVDSGSTDGSVSLAQSLGAVVVALDMATPFTAARARNQGFEALREGWPALDYVLFVDGDCVVDPHWPDAALAFLDQHADMVAVSGRRQEKYPQRSVYNLLCDLDWHCQVGETRSFGGDVMLRATALHAVGGYNPALIAGEEPELAIRLRRAGWRIWQLDLPMTLHDANILHFKQWWRRGMRTGYAYAEGASLYGAPPERHWVRQTRSALFWGGALPTAVLATLLWGHSVALALVALYPLQVLRLFLQSPLPARQAAIRALFLVIGKFAEARGALKFHAARLKGARSRIIEYK